MIWDPHTKEAKHHEDRFIVVASTSPATSMAVAFLLLARLIGHANAEHIRDEMGFAIE